MAEELYRSLWEPEIYQSQGSKIFLENVDLTTLTVKERQAWFFQFVSFVDQKKISYQHQTLAWTINNLKTILGQRLDPNQTELQTFGLYDRRKTLISQLSPLERYHFQLAIAMAEQRKYIILAPDFLDNYLKLDEQDCWEQIQKFTNQTVLGFTTFSLNNEPVPANVIDLSDEEWWINHRRLTIYPRDSLQFRGYVGHWRSRLGLIAFLWKRIWKFWLPIGLIDLGMYSTGVFMLLVHSIQGIAWLQIVGFSLVALTAVSLALTTIISYFRLRTQYTFLQFISIGEQNVNMILPTYVLVIAISICLFSYLVNFLVFLTDIDNLSLGDWMDTLYVSTAFILWSLGVSVFMIISFERNYNIFKLLGLKKWKENLTNKKQFVGANSKRW